MSSLCDESVPCSRCEDFILSFEPAVTKRAFELQVRGATEAALRSVTGVVRRWASRPTPSPPRQEHHAAYPLTRPHHYDYGHDCGTRTDARRWGDAGPTPGPALPAAYELPRLSGTKFMLRSEHQPQGTPHDPAQGGDQGYIRVTRHICKQKIGAVVSVSYITY